MAKNGFDPNNQYDIKKLILTDRSGNQWDLRNYMLELNLYHSLFKSVSTGNFTFNDPHDWRTNMPIMGGETLTFRFKAFPSSDYTNVVYRVVGIKEVVQTENSALVKLILVSEEGYRDASIVKSLPNDGSFYKLVYNQFALLGSQKEITVTDAANVDAMAHTLMLSPLENIRLAATRAHSTDGTPMLFYEDIDGFYFKSLGSLLASQPEAQFLLDPESISPDQERDYLTIRDYQYTAENFNVLRMARDKIENRVDFYFDVMTKGCTNTTRSYSSEFATGQSLEAYPNQTSGNEESANVWMLAMDDGSDKFLYNRNLYLDALQNFSLSTVTIASDFLRVGKVYRYNIRSNALAENSRKLNEQYVSGKFLLTSIKRTFTPDEYIVSSTLVKDSLSKELSNG